MGRIITTERRQAAIDWWRVRFRAASIGKRPTIPVLVDRLDLNAANLNAAERNRLAEARQNLTTVLALPAEVQAPALDAWLARYLVDTGPHLLLDKVRRNAVLATIRDRDRQKRGRQDAISQDVMLRLPENTVQQLRQFACDNKLPNDGAAIKALLEFHQSKYRHPAKRLTPRIAVLDLLTMLEPESLVGPAKLSKPGRGARKNKRLTN